MMRDCRVRLDALVKCLFTLVRQDAPYPSPTSQLAVSILPELERRFRAALTSLDVDPEPLLGMIRRSQDPKFGDYQANFAMPLGKQLGKPPRDVAGEIVSNLDIEGFCELPEIAGPGFINLRVRDDWIIDRLTSAVGDERLGVPTVAERRTYVVDFSAPNVAKPMHVGHIRSTSIGDALSRTLRFAGHTVVTDNHIGDWGAQFGMIIYGYRHFCDTEAYESDAVHELARLYRLVRQLMDYHDGKAKLDGLAAKLNEAEERLEETLSNTEDQKPDKKAKKVINKLRKDVEEGKENLQGPEREDCRNRRESRVVEVGSGASGHQPSSAGRDGEAAC